MKFIALADEWENKELLQSYIRLLFVILVDASFHDAKVVIKQEETKCVQFVGNNIYITVNNSRPQQEFQWPSRDEDIHIMLQNG